jgi:predicted amidohydrolase
MGQVSQGSPPEALAGRFCQDESVTWERLDIALMQLASGLEPEANRELLLAAPGADLVVFPEAFARDFGPVEGSLGAFAEPLDGPFAQAVAKLPGTVVAGMFEASGDPERPFNTLVTSRGDSYRKIHLYDSFGYRESDRLTAGPLTPALVDIDGVRTGLMTCYDLRFPELARSLVEAGAELLVLPAAWVAGERKVDHWRTLLRARAIENTVYVAAAAQPAPRYSGHSMIVDPLGDVLVELDEAPGVARGTIERDRLVRARAINPSLANRRL